MRPGQGVKEGLHQLPRGDIETLVWIPAQVPGDVYTDLWRAGALEDPYFGCNSFKAQWVMQDEWWYSLQFNVSEEMKDKVVRLEFDGVDYSCEVWLNGQYLGSHQGVFSRFSFDITKLVQSDRNWLKGRNMLMVKLDPPPQVNHKVAGLKTPWFGDYWRDLVPFGIWRPVRLVATGPARIDDVYVKSSLRQDGAAELDVAVTLENHSEREKTVSLAVTVKGQNFSGPTVQAENIQVIKPGKRVIKTKVYIEDPRLWWPWDLGEQNLYTAEVMVKEDGRIHDRNQTTFGIREIRDGVESGLYQGRGEFSANGDAQR